MILLLGECMSVVSRENTERAEPIAYCFGIHSPYAVQSSLPRWLEILLAVVNEHCALGYGVRDVQRPVVKRAVWLLRTDVSRSDERREDRGQVKILHPVRIEFGGLIVHRHHAPFLP